MELRNILQKPKRVIPIIDQWLEDDLKQLEKTKTYSYQNLSKISR